MSKSQKESGDSRLEEVRIKVEKVVEQAQKNISLAIPTTIQLHEIEDKSIKLLEDADKFKDGSGQIRRTYRNRNIRCWCIIFWIVAIVIAIIVGVAIWSSKSASN
jgi:hypothetical protein